MAITEDKAFAAAYCFIGLLVLFIFSLLLIGPHFKAKTYTRITGVEVTYWDAFFMELDPSKHVVMIEKEVNK